MGLPPIHRSSGWLREKKKNNMLLGHLRGSVGWVSQLLMPAQVLASGHGFKPHIGLCTRCGAYFKKKEQHHQEKELQSMVREKGAASNSSQGS